MRSVIKVVGAISGISGFLLVAVALVVAYFLPEKLRDLGKEPEDFYLLLALTLLSLPCGLLMIWNAFLLCRSRAFHRWEFRFLAISLFVYFSLFSGIGVAMRIRHAPIADPDIWLFLPLAGIIGITLLGVIGKNKFARRLESGRGSTQAS